MDRFGSSRLRIVWVSACLLLAGLALGAIQGFAPDGSQVIVCGAGIPLGFQDAKPIIVENLGRLIYTLVPAVILLGGFIPLGEWLAAGSRGERFKGLFLGSGLALLHGLFLSQVALIPVMAASYKFFHNPFAPWLLQADLNAVLLGFQLLLWTAALGLLLKSNRGLAILLSFGLMAIGKYLAWLGEWGADLELPKALVKGAAFLGHLVPTETLPSDPFSLTALPLSIGGPLVLAALLLLLPGKAAKRPKA